MSVDLPGNADLDRLKGDAKVLRDWVRAGVEGALELVRVNHPRHAGLRAGSAAASAFRLSDAQLVLARHYGFASWPKLRAHVDVVRGLARWPHQVDASEDQADELLRLGCLNYGEFDERRLDEARGLLAAHPELASASIYTAGAAGDTDAVAERVAGEPGLADREGGPFGWPPLLYLTYSRLGTGDPVGTARVLLGAGADPNAGYLWEGLVPPFTALTGAFGGGERQDPPHPLWRELATVLLEAGADPNDHQTAYNRGSGDLASDDVEWLELLYRFGLGEGDGDPWRRRLGEALPEPAVLIAEVLQHAAAHDLRRRAALVLSHGADPDRPAAHPLYEGRTAYREALRNGNLEIADLLARAGADIAGVDAPARAVAAAMAGDPTAGGADPTVIEAAIERDPLAIVRAGELGRVAAVAALVTLGWDVNVRCRATALHEAAFRGHGDVVAALLGAGADATVRDEQFDATAAGWAAHGGHTALAERLAHAEQTSG